MNPPTPTPPAPPLAPPLPLLTASGRGAPGSSLRILSGPPPHNYLAADTSHRPHRARHATGSTTIRSS